MRPSGRLLPLQMATSFLGTSRLGKYEGMVGCLASGNSLKDRIPARKRGTAFGLFLFFRAGILCFWEGPARHGFNAAASPQTNGPSLQLDRLAFTGCTGGAVSTDQ